MYRISQKRQSCSRFLKIPKLLRDDDEVSDDNEIKHFFLGGAHSASHDVCRIADVLTQGLRNYSRA